MTTLYVAEKLWETLPDRPVRSKPIEVYVVGKRCVYVNDYRVAGGKPYYSENLPAHTLKTTLGEVLDAFSVADIEAALAESKAHAIHLAKYHQAKHAEDATLSRSSENRNG